MTTAARVTAPMLTGSLAQDIVNGWEDPIAVLDQGLLVTFANRAFCDWVTLAWQKLDGQPLAHFMDSPDVSDFLRDVLSGSVVRALQVKCEVSEIGNRMLSLSADLFLNSTQPAILLRISDITDGGLTTNVLNQKVRVAEREETKQRREADLLRSIMESSGDGIFVADAEGNCVLWNPACEQLLGLRPDALMHLKKGQWTEDFGAYLNDKITPFPVEDLPLSRALKGESSDNVELWIKNKTHPEGHWISVTSRPLTGGQDGAISTLRDITFARNAELALAERAEEVARSNRELEQFAYVAAHDLQEPLRMVSSYVQLLAKRYQGKLDSEANEFIGFATDGAKRMSQLINDLLSYSRIGRGTVPEEMVDCEEVLKYVLLSLSPKNAIAGANITHDPLPKIKANELQITQVFQNLIDNAIKFRSKDDPRVHISARAEGNKWIFSVADNGIGIEAEYKERIFVIFQRLNPREEYDGTGIGLAVCKKIVEQNDGNIWVAPNQGHGTIVYFTWP